MSNGPMPSPGDVRKTLTALVGKAVRVDKTKDDDLSVGAWAPYVTDEGVLHAVAAFEFPLAAGIGGALSMVPPPVVQEGVKKMQMGQAELDGFVECCNVMAQLFNVSESPHVQIGEVVTEPDSPPDEIESVVGNGKETVVWKVDVEEYGTGRMWITLV